MKHKNYKGKAICNTLNHSMYLVDDWKDVDCGRCLRSKRREKDLKRIDKDPDYKGFCEEFDERVEKGFPIDKTIMKEMAEVYNTPVPRINKNGVLVWGIVDEGFF